MTFNPDLNRIVALLGTHSGRDKTIRTAYYTLLFFSGRMKNRILADRLLAVAKQLSLSRLIGRQLGDAGMLKTNLDHFFSGSSSKADSVSHYFRGIVNVLYLLYNPVEHIAWLSSMELLPFNAERWFHYCVKIWVMALTVSILNSIRNYVLLAERNARDEFGDRRLHEQQREELLNVLMYLSDFMNAINFLPKGFLWSQTFPAWKVGAFGVIASFVGLLKLYKATK